MTHNIYLYILVAAAVSSLIRILPLTLIRRKIRNPFRLFLRISVITNGILRQVDRRKRRQRKTARKF